MWTLPSLVYFFAGWLFGVAGMFGREVDERLGALTIACGPLWILAGLRILYDLDDPWTRITASLPGWMRWGSPDPRSLAARVVAFLIFALLGLTWAGWGVTALV